MSAPAMAVASVFVPAMAADDVPGGDGLADPERQQSDLSRWEIAPYLWVANLKGSIGLGRLNVPIDVGMDELASGIDAGGMGFLRWSDDRQFVYVEGLGIKFSDESLEQFRDQPVDAQVVFTELGYGRTFGLDVSFPAVGKLYFGPYVGVRYVQLEAKINNRLRPTAADDQWIDPVVGVMLEAPLWQNLSYNFKVDAAGLGTGRDDYWSVVGVLRYGFNEHWSVAGGYRISRFDAHPGGTNTLTLNLRGTGAMFGIIYSF